VSDTPTDNPNETAEETALKLGLVDGQITPDQFNQFTYERDKIERARAEAKAAASAPPPPPPSPDDLLGQARARAAAYREEDAQAEDLRTVLLRESRDGLTQEELNGMTLSDLRLAAGIDKSADEIEADLAYDYQANREAADREETSFGSDRWKERLAADIAAHDSKPSTDNGGDA
jgi:hypothetical protein